MTHKIERMDSYYEAQANHLDSLFQACREAGGTVGSLQATEAQAQGGGEVVAWHVVDELGGLIADYRTWEAQRELARMADAARCNGGAA